MEIFRPDPPRGPENTTRPLTNPRRPDGGADGPGKDPYMNRMEQLEKKKKAAEKAAKEAAKEIGRLKRAETWRQKQAAKEKEMAEAVEFVAYCKQKEIFFGQGENRHSRMAYEWLMADMAADKREGKWTGAPQGPKG